MASFPYRPLRHVQFAKLEDEIRLAHEDIVERSEKIIAARRGAWELRLLVLQPSSVQDAALEGKLIRKSLNSVRSDEHRTPRDSDITSYEALSYVWDDETPSHLKALGIDSSINLNGLHFSITPNLHAALRRLRLRDKARVLFVDQICINQQDIVEKSFLVDRMTLIYSLCSRTIVWLGESINQSWRGMLLLKKLARVSSFNDELEMSLFDAEGLFDGAAWRCLDKLFRRRWWKRTWTVQECALAKVVDIHCGERSLSWTELATALATITYLRQQPKQPICVHEIGVEDAIAMSETRANSYNRLLNVLAQHRTREATDPRDKVFAIRRLAADVKESFLNDLESSNVPVADYNQPVSFIYTDVAKFCLLKGDIDILMHCRESQIIPNMPSWAPDWSDASSFPQPFDYQNRKRLLSYYSDVSFGVKDGLMQCSISIMDRPDLLGPRISNGDCDPFLIPSSVFDWVQTIKPDHPGLNHPLQDFEWSGPNSFEKALIRTLVADDRDIHDLKTAFKELTRAAGVMAELMVDHPVKYLNATSSVAIQKACVGRRLLFTTHKRLALAPAGTQQGDIIVAFAGCPLPLVIRPQDESNSAFKIIGPCYLDRAVEIRSWTSPEGSFWPDRDFKETELMKAFFI